MTHCVHVITDSSERRWYEWTIGDRLRVARERAGYDQREFAKVTGISRATIVNYEHGTYSPRPPMLAAWCLATGFDKGWILTGHKPTDDGNGEDVPANVTLRQHADIWRDGLDEIKPTPLLKLVA